MAKIIYSPNLHDCRDELKDLGSQRVGTVAQCSCGTRWVVREDQRDGYYWTPQPGPVYSVAQQIDRGHGCDRGEGGEVR